MSPHSIQQTLQLAVQHHQAGHLPEAETLYRRVLQQDPQQADALHLLGLIAHQRGNNEAALEQIGQAILFHDSNPDFHFDLGLVYHALHRPDEAILSYQRALALKPDQAVVYYNLGNVFNDQGRLDQAIACYQQAVALGPDLAEAHHNLGNALSKQGKLEEAVGCYRRALTVRPEFAAGLSGLAGVLIELGMPEEAVTCCRRALAIDPTFAEAYANLGNACSNLGRLTEAVDAYQQALALWPELAGISFNLGNVLDCLGKVDEAANYYRQAIALRPGYAIAHYKLGNTYIKQGKPEAAIASYTEAIASDPALPGAHFNLGNTYRLQARSDEAIACYQRALAIKPDFAEAYHELGNVYLDRGDPDSAVSCFRMALTHKSNFARVYSHLGLALLAQGRPDECHRQIQELVKAKTTFPDSSLLFAMHYIAAYTPGEILAVHRRFAERVEFPLKSSWPVHTNTRDPEQRLKVGYVSPDLCCHSVAFFMEPVLARHDPQQVEVYCYYTSALRDAVTERLAAYAVHWISCYELSDEQLATRIREDGIDILVDLAGHTQGNRLLTFARKPAPVQVTYLGYPATTGLTAIDYRLTTFDVDPEGTEGDYTEHLYRLPRTLWCYRPPTDRPEIIGQTPALNMGRVTFGSMNNLAKVSPKTIVLWAEILRAIPGARLVMTSVPEGTARQVLLERFAAYGIRQERLTLHGRLSADEFQVLPQRIDLALDPFPYNGTTTTCEALWMGIPVITQIGSTAVSRSGYALLKSVGLETLAAPDDAGYVRLGVELAGDLGRLDTLRRGLRARMESSPLRDEEGLARDIEAAYRAMWRKWCATTP